MFTLSERLWNGIMHRMFFLLVFLASLLLWGELMDTVAVVVWLFRRFLPLGFSDRLERRAGGGASILLPSSHCFARAHERPLLGTLLVVQALDPVEILVHLHVLHLPLGRGLARAVAGGVGVRGSCRSRGDLPGGQDSPVPRLRGVQQGMADVHSVRRQGSHVCGQATCNQLSTANQLRTVDLKEEAEKNIRY